VSSVLDRLRRTIKQRGVVGTLRLLPARLLAHVVHKEHHVWYELDPAAISPRELRPGYQLERGGPENLPLPDQDEREHERYSREMARGNELWLVCNDGDVAFYCFLYRHESPTVAASGGRLRLPEQTVCLESSTTLAEHRGKGIAPAAWTLLAARLRDQGVTSLITKVETSNTPSRRACEKAGFREIARMTYTVTGLRSRVHIDGEPAGMAGELAQRLNR